MFADLGGLTFGINNPRIGIIRFYMNMKGRLEVAKQAAMAGGEQILRY